MAWMVETEVGGDSGNWAHDPRGLFHDERDAKSRVDEWVRTYGIPTKYIRVVPLYRDRSGGGE